MKLSLIGPVCTEIGERVAISRRIDRKWRFFSFYQIYLIRLIGLGEIIGCMSK